MTPDGVVDWLTADPARTGLLADFDGTLSSIVDDPEAATPLAGVVSTLHGLASRLAVVAVVSGRPARFLVDRLALEGSPGRLHAYGLHGLEHTTGSGIEVAPAVLAWQEPLRAAWDDLERGAPPGIVLEDKGFGLTLHWRLASSPAAAQLGRALADQVAAAHGLHVRPGRASVELVPPVGVDKGTVVLEWGRRLASTAGVAARRGSEAGEAARLGSEAGEASLLGSEAGRAPRLAFFGDDVGDELAFEALAVLASGGTAHALRVAVRSAEAPSSLLDTADVVLDEPAEAARVLALALERLDATARRPPPA